MDERVEVLFAVRLGAVAVPDRVPQLDRELVQMARAREPIVRDAPSHRPARGIYARPLPPSFERRRRRSQRGPEKTTLCVTPFSWGNGGSFATLHGRPNSAGHSASHASASTRYSPEPAMNAPRAARTSQTKERARNRAFDDPLRGHERSPISDAPVTLAPCAAPSQARGSRAMLGLE